MLTFEKYINYPESLKLCNKRSRKSKFVSHFGLYTPTPVERHCLFTAVCGGMSIVTMNLNTF